jgi:putative transposase
MKRSRFSEEQIISILKEHEAGVPVSDFCRKHGVSNASIYKWKARFGGMDVSEAKRLRALDVGAGQEIDPVDRFPGGTNGKLKRMLADAMLDNVALKDLLGKNVWSAPSVQGFAISPTTIPVA